MLIRPNFYFLGLAALMGLSSCEGDLFRVPSSSVRGIASPEALYPVNGQTMSPDRIEYAWEASERAVQYQLYISQGQSLKSPEKEYKSPALGPNDICNDGVCRYSPAYKLELGHEHQYKVIAMDESGKAAVTTVEYKVTKSARPARPVHIRPKHGATIPLKSGISFSWRAVAGAFSYDLLVYDRVAQKSIYRESFLGPKEVCSKQVCSVTPKLDISPGKNHYFRVIATSFNGQSDANYSSFHVTESSEVGSNARSHYSAPSKSPLFSLSKRAR